MSYVQNDPQQFPLQSTKTAWASFFNTGSKCHVSCHVKILAATKTESALKGSQQCTARYTIHHWDREQSWMYLYKRKDRPVLRPKFRFQREMNFD